MHKKLAQAKGSIIVGNESSHTVSRDNTKSPVQEEKQRQSSNLRVRLDDTDSQLPVERSKSKISDKGPLSFHSDPPRINDPKSPLSEKDKIQPPEIDFDDLEESINENIPAARQTELRRLREENQELHERLKQINKKQDVPLAMTTFSPRKEPSATDLHPSLTDAKEPHNHRLTELSKRLINVMLKLGLSVQKYLVEECSISVLKDMVYDIQMQVEEILNKNSQFNLTRPPDSNRNSSSPNYLSQLGGERVPYHGRGTGLQTDATSGHFGYDVDATTDISNFRANSGERKHSGERNTEFEMRH